ncbi:MAG TPA: hypothetical protein VMW67_00780 [Desulfobacteria bacterium]|nr:hypothetical protein [Desulfobacteria bacterium]
MGKTWLLLEVGRQLAASDDFLVGYFEAKGGTELIQRAVHDLYLRWYSTAQVKQKLKLIWNLQGGTFILRCLKALLPIIQILLLGDIRKFSVLIMNALVSIAQTDQDLKTLKIKYESLPTYESVHGALARVRKIDNKNKRLMLILDAWDQSDAIIREKRILEAIAKHIDDTEIWSCCHFLVSVKDDRVSSQALEATGKISKHHTTLLYELQRMEMDEQEKQQRFNLQDKISLLKDLTLDRIEELHHGYPGTIESWRNHASEISSEEDLQRFAQEAWDLEYGEFDKLLPSLEGDELLWAIRIAFFRRLDSDSWKIYQDILSDGIDKNHWKKLLQLGVFEWRVEENPAVSEYFPTYGHETRHQRVRRWFLERQTIFGPDVSEEITRLCFALASKIQNVDTGALPFGAALLEYLSKVLKPVVSDDAYACAYSAAILLDVSPKFFDLRSFITHVVEQESKTSFLLIQGLSNRGYIDLNCGNTEAVEEAIKDLTKAIEIPNISNTLLATNLVNRGRAYHKIGRINEAKADFDKVIDMPDAPIWERERALVNRGIAFKQLKNPKAAMADYNTVIEMPNAFPYYKSIALRLRGLLLIGESRKKNGCKDLIRALKLCEKHNYKDIIEYTRTIVKQNCKNIKDALPEQDKITKE